ncbi:TetR family transcriptional regulator [Streptomyces sp. CAU 1734]|uniref:TetR/AcrR family transcriptional regulator n=1 Tax=Streptomyces sp. CAU 1734 TaxID=3140360 RepID=UPI003260214F
MARRYDPGRRERIIDAALRVIGRDGIGGLSHRTVAAEADVPLGSTTYHFASLDELLTAALRRTNANFVSAVREATGLTAPGADLAAGVARLMGDWMAAGRAGAELEYELYLAALRRPVLRPVVAEWTRDVVEMLTRHTDPVTARALVAVMDGISLQVLLNGTEYDEEYAREMLARILAGSPAGAGRGAGASPAPGPGCETGSLPDRGPR